MSGFINWITNTVLAVCFGVKELAVFLVAMVPIIELRGAIPVGLKLGLGSFQSFLWAFLGSSLVAVPLLLLLPWVFKWPGFRRIKQVFEDSAGKVPQKWKLFGLFIFAAVPLPGTGSWTASAVAVILGIKFTHALIPIVAGNLIAGLAIWGLTALLGEAGLDVLITVLFAAFVLLLAVFLYKVFKKKPSNGNKLNLQSGETKDGSN